MSTCKHAKQVRAIMVAITATLVSINVQAASIDYTWTGAAEDGNWNTPENWDSPGIPVDQSAGDSGLNGDMIITFSGNNLPSLSVPNMGGGASLTQLTPVLKILNGGTINLTYQNHGIYRRYEDGISLQVGDGIGGASNVIVNIASVDHNGFNLCKDGTGLYSTNIVYSDGVLNTPQEYYMTVNANRHGILVIDGGEVNVGRNMDGFSGYDSTVGTQSKVILKNGGTLVVASALREFQASAITVDFQGGGCSLAAKYSSGDNFASFSAVTNAINTTFISTTGNDIEASDLGASGFEVKTLMPPEGTVISIQ